jgi:hypothetical protein
MAGRRDEIPDFIKLRSKRHSATSVTLLHSTALRKHHMARQNNGPFTTEKLVRNKIGKTKRNQHGFTEHTMKRKN